MANIGSLTAHIGMDTARLRADTMRARGMFSRFSAGATRSIAKVGGALAALGLSMGAIVIFKKMTQVGVDFEQTMTTVAGVMRATADEMEALTSVARRMGETTEWTASQSGDALLFLGMAGFEAAEAVKALPGVLDLATAGNLQLGRAADIASNALTAMQLPIKDLARVNDVFVGTITRSNVNMEQMAEAFKYAAPVAKAFGYSIEELSGMIGMLGNAGVQGSMAGTQLAMAIQKANEVAIKFRYSSSDLLDVLESMAKEGKTNADFMDLFGLRAGRAALILKDMIAPTKEFQETLGRTAGEAAILAEKMRDTVGGAFKTLKSVIESLALDTFETYRDRLKATIQSTTEWLRKNKEQIVGVAGAIVKSFGMVIAILQFVGVVLAALGRGFSDFFGSIERGAANTAEAIGRSGEEIRAALDPPKPTLWQAFVSWMEEAGRNMLYAMEFVVRSVTALFAGLVKFVVSDVVGNMIEAFQQFGYVLEAILTLRFDRLGKAVEDYRDKFHDVFRDMAATSQGMMDSWVNAWDDMITEIENRPGPEVFGPAIPEDSGLSALFDQLVHRAKEVSLITQGEAEETAKAVGDSYRGILDAQVMLYQELLDSAKATGENLGAIWEGYKNARLQQIAAEAEELAKMGIAADVIFKWSKTQLQGLKEEWKNLIDNTEAYNQRLADQANLYQGLLQSGRLSRDAMQTIWEDYKNARLQQIAEEARAFHELGMSAELIAEVIYSKQLELAEEGKEIFATSTQEVEELFGHIGNFAGDTFRNIMTSGKTMSESLKDSFRSFMMAMVNMMAKMLATFIANSLLELFRHSATEHAKTAVTAAEEAKRAAIRAAFAIATGPLNLIPLAGGGLVEMQRGGLVRGMPSPRDNVPALLSPGEYVLPEPVVRRLGIPALERMRRGEALGGGVTVHVDMGGFTFSNMDRRDAYKYLGQFEDSVVRAVKEGIRKGSLEI